MTAGLGALVGDLATCLQFFSRLPVQVLHADRDSGPSRFGSAIRVLPVAALAMGGCGAVPLVLARWAGLPDEVAAALAVGGLILASGGLHEDGLADTADGLGGGSTRERKLAIMRDSRIGTYGVLALVVALLLRITLLSTMLGRHGLLATTAALLAAAAVSRALALLPMLCLPPARPDGLGRGVGTIPAGAALSCGILAIVFGLGLPGAAGTGLLHGLVGCGLALCCCLALTGLARRQIGGHTGDIGGASQQVGETCFLLGLLAFPQFG